MKLAHPSTSVLRTYAQDEREMKKQEKVSAHPERSGAKSKDAQDELRRVSGEVEART